MKENTTWTALILLNEFLVAWSWLVAISSETILGAQ
jgi:hypothetical protein